MIKVTTQSGTAQPASRCDQPSMWRIAFHAILHVAWQSLKTLSRGIKFVVRATVNFWNIPVLGADETRESRYYRTKHNI